MVIRSFSYPITIMVRMTILASSIMNPPGMLALNLNPERDLLTRLTH
jgi:hypothetical protein